MKLPNNKITKSDVFIKIEIILLLFGVISLYVLLDRFALGGPISTDVIGYSNDSLLGLAMPPIVNRYFHVFLQAIFLKLASTPLAGLQHYWAFLISATSGLTYLAARLFSKRSQVMHGLLAVMIFFSIGQISDTAGIPLVDITAMFMMMSFTVLVILSARQGHQSVVLIIMLGFVLYLAFRTKETALLAGLVIFGLGMTGEKGYDWKLFLRRILYMVFGMLAAIVFFIILNTIFLHTPFFGFRLSDLKEFFAVYVGGLIGGKSTAENNNWFTAYLFTGLLIPFTLYLVSAMKAARDVENYPGMGLVWLIPLAVVIFVSLSVSKHWGFIPRYVFTIFPFVSFLAPQYLSLDIGSGIDKRHRLQAIVTFTVGLVILVISRIIIRYCAPKLGWDIGLFLEMVFIPILFSVILALSFSWKMPSLIVSTLITLLIFGIISIDIVNNAKVAVRDHPNLNTSQQLFYPFSAYSNQIHYDSRMHFFVAQDIWELLGTSTYVKDRNELSDIFNIYFDVSSTKNNFTLLTQTKDISGDLLNNDYEYALLSMDDWKAITQDPATETRLELIYQVFQEGTHQVVFLKHK